jgi:DNA-binding NtrC family response regulator
MSLLKGRAVLIVEDEPLIAMDIAQAFDKVGALVTTTNTLRHALVLVENDGLAAAVLDHGLGDGDSSALCKRLAERDIPFVLYTGFSKIEGACAAGVHVNKPASPEALVKTVEDLLEGRRISH